MKKYCYFGFNFNFLLIWVWCSRSGGTPLHGIIIDICFLFFYWRKSRDNCLLRPLAGFDGMARDESDCTTGFE